jgi:hypothetical protein
VARINAVRGYRVNRDFFLWKLHGNRTATIECVSDVASSCKSLGYFQCRRKVPTHGMPGWHEHDNISVEHSMATARATSQNMVVAMEEEDSGCPIEQWSLAYITSSTR